MGALCRRLAVLRQRLFELLFDAESIGGGARPEFPQRMPIALAPEEKSLMVFPALAEEGDNAVGELAEGHGVEGRGSIQWMMSAPWPPIRSRRSRVAPSAAAWAGCSVSAACSISSPLKADTNPAGLISCTVRVWQFAHGQWFPIMGVARWDEFAPIKVVWIDNQPTDRKVLDKSGRWADVPFLMLAECAEAQAIRKGWPEDLSNTFVRRSGKQATRSIPPAR